MANTEKQCVKNASDLRLPALIEAADGTCLRWDWISLFPVTCPGTMTDANQNQHLVLVAKCHWAQKQGVGQKQMVSNRDSPWHWCKCTMQGSTEQLRLPIYAVLNESLSHNLNCGLPSPSFITIAVFVIKQLYLMGVNLQELT